MLEHMRQIAAALPIIMGSLQQGRMLSPQPFFEQNLRVDHGNQEDRSTSPMSREKSAETLTAESSRAHASSDYALSAQGTPGPPMHSLSQPAETCVIPAARRYRTSTIAGNDIMKEAKSRPTHLFGSLVSLDPSALPSSPAEGHKNPHRYRRRHDEYTSITDAISIENVPMLSQTTTPMVFVQPETGNMHESLISYGARTDNDEEDVGMMLSKDGEDETLRFDERSTSDDSDRGIYTPNEELRRARASFVQRQNTLLKEHEEVS